MRAWAGLGLYTAGLRAFCRPGCLFSEIGLLLNKQKIQARWLCPKPRPMRTRAWALSGPRNYFANYSTGPGVHKNRSHVGLFFGWIDYPHVFVKILILYIQVNCASGEIL
jgi:hypothetical protein